MPHGPSSKTTTRELRAHLREILAQAARGKEIVVTLRGKPYVRIVPVAGDDPPSRYPLRGSIRFVADNFDDPLSGVAQAPQKKPEKKPERKPAKPKRRKKQS